MRLGALLRRAAVFLAGDAAARGVAFLVLLLAGRVLGPAGLGSFAAVYATGSVLLLVSDLGLTPMVLRAISRRGLHGGVFWTALSVNVGTSLVLYGASVGVCSVFARSYAVLLAVYELVVLVQAPASSFEAGLLATGRSSRVALNRVYGNVILAVVAALALTTDGGPLSLAVAFVVANIAKAVMGFVSLRRDLPEPTFRLRLVRPLIGRAFPFAAAAIASFLYFRSDTILVAALAGRRAAGLYSAGYRFLDAILLLPGAVAYVAFPGWTRRPPGLDEIRKLFWGLAGIATVAALLTFAVAPTLVTLTLGKSFSSSFHVLRILLIGLPALFLDYALVWIAYSHRRERSVCLIGLAAFVVNVLVNVSLIPAFGLMGAAVATDVAEFVNLAGYVLLFRLGWRPHLQVVAGWIGRYVGIAATSIAAEVALLHVAPAVLAGCITVAIFAVQWAVVSRLSPLTTSSSRAVVTPEAGT